MTGKNGCKMKRNLVLITVMVLLHLQFLHCETLEFMKAKISYLGLPVCFVDYTTQISENDYQIDISVSSSWWASIFQQVENTYRICGTLPEWQPQQYLKEICESKVNENSVLAFHNNELHYSGIVNGTPIDTLFRHHQPLRDFFSALHWLRFSEADSSIFYLEASRKIWRAEMRREGKFIRDGQSYLRVKVGFYELDSRRKALTDILTYSLVNNRATLTIDFQDSQYRYPDLMIYRKDDYCVTWKLLESATNQQ